MKTLHNLLSALTATLLSAHPISAAAPTGIFQNSGKFKATGGVSESHIEKLGTMSDGTPGGKQAVIYLSGGLKVSLKANFAGVDISQFSSTTPFTFTFGAFTVSGTLGGDPKYAPGKKTAKIVIMEDDFFGDPFDSGYIKFSWTEKTLSVAVVNYPLFNEAIVDTLLNTAPEPNEVYKTSGESPISLNFGGTIGTRDVVYATKILNTEKELNLGTNGKVTEFCSSASIAGGFDIKAPKMISRFPTKAAPAAFNLDLEFLDTDQLASAALSVDGAPAVLGSISVDNTSQPGKRFVNIAGLALPIGARKLVLTVQDESGNVATIKKSIKVE